MEENIIKKNVNDIIFYLLTSGNIFGNRYIVVSKEIVNKSNKVVVYFDLYSGEMHAKKIHDFSVLTKDMDMNFTKDIINIDYTNEEKG